MTRIGIAVLLVAAMALAGCTKINDLIGMGNDNSVIPGQREDAIPGQTQFPGPGETIQPGSSSADGTAVEQPPAGAGQQTAAQGEKQINCVVGDPDCPTGTAPTTAEDGTFSDPQ
ncbi:MAG: hypothetical protein FJX63_11020 [Alphaproteobacteria bacterium]|nr:hypothetical protein [Alphaproteobacteria bacterium]